MICERCNEEIEDGRVYCPKCGLELHYVPDYNEVDEELEKNVLTMEDMNSAKASTVEEEDEEYRLERELTDEEKRIRIIAKIAGLATLIVVLIVCSDSFLVINTQKNSYRVQIKNGKMYAKEDNFSKAVISYENAINKAKGKEETAKASRELGMFYAKNSDTKNAVYYLEMAIENGADDAEVIKQIVKLYEIQGNSDAIKKLAFTNSTDKTYSLFEKYLLNQPVFNYKSGTYNEYLNVEITSDDNEKIYYTLDDSPATTESFLYEAPIEVKEGTTVIHAITVNKNNLISQEIVTTYNVQSAKSMTPTIYPESGEYSEFTKITIDNISANCKIYYTLDGTDPTSSSNEYTQSFEMPVGNHVVKAVAINTLTNESSEIVSKVYNLDISSKYDLTKATKYVMEQLEKREKVVNTSGALPDGSSIVVQFEEEVIINAQNYYIMHQFKSIGGQLFDEEIYYAVNIDTKDVFLAQKVKDGIYNLDTF